MVQAFTRISPGMDGVALKRVRLTQSARERVDREKLREQGRKKFRTMEFTDKSVAKLLPEDKLVEWNDRLTPGLHVLVNEKGTKTWRSSVMLHGKEVRRKIGRVGVMSLEEAREVVREDRRKASQGVDPRAEINKINSTLTSDVLTRFVTEHCQIHQRSWKQTEVILRRHLEPWYSRPMAQVTRHELKALVDGLVTSGKPASAFQLHAWLRVFWKWAWTEELIADNPMARVKLVAPIKEKKDRSYTEAEFKAIWKAADQINAVQGSFVKLLALTGLRKNELAGAKWSEFSEVDGKVILTVPFERTKSRKTAKARTYKVPLTPLAVRVLRTLPKRHDELVFGRREVPLDAHTYLAKQLLKAGAPEGFGFHRFRHSVASWLREQGHDDFEIGLCLNHSAGGGVTAGYIHSIALRRKAELLQEWAEHIEQLVQPAEGVRMLR